MKKNKNYQATARLEINVLEKLNKKDPEGKKYIVNFYDLSKIIFNTFYI